MACRLFGHGQVLPPFYIPEEYRDGSFKVVYVSNSSFSFLFIVPVSHMTPHLGYFYQLTDHFCLDFLNL